MRDHGERVVRQSLDRRNFFRARYEPVGDQRRRRNATPLRCECVVQTARRAASSVSDPGHDRVGHRQLGEHLGRDRSRRVRLATSDELAHAVLAQEVFQMVVEVGGAYLRIVEQADRRALQHGGRCEGERLELGIDSGVEDSDSHGFSSMRIVTAKDFAPNHGGMIAPNPPDGPPAETTSRSSGVRSAVWTRSGSLPTTDALPTDAQSPLLTHARSCTYSRMSYFDPPATALTCRFS